MGFHIDKYHFKSGSILEGLPQKEFRILKQGMVRIEEKRGKLIYREGTYSKGGYILRKGKVKIFQTNKDGKEQIVYIYKKGELMGYRPLLCNEPHPISAVTLEDCIISFIPKKCFLEALQASGVLANRLLVNLSHEFSVWINKISVFAQQPVRARIALSLLILSEKYRKQERKDIPVVIDLSRDDLASYVGTAKETLVRLLHDLKQRHIVSSKGRKITILKPEELEIIADLY